MASAGPPAASLGNPQLWGAVAVFVLAARRVNLLVCVAVGVAIVAILRVVSG